MIGQVVDGHEIVRSLGAGGMGQVYLARGAGGSLRAFKVVRSDRATDPQSAARFRREVLALGKLRHPSIVQTYEAGRLASGELYLGMEYVAGPDLQAAIGWEGPFGVADGLRILVQLAAALAYAHSVGVVHRDLKPSNVILCEGDPARAKIIDFGLAKIAADEGLTRLTEDQQMLGSPLYWAPEQGSAVKVGPAADIYSLGGMAYFVLSGQPMFRPRPAVALVYAHAHEAPEPLEQRCRDITLPAGLDELVHACVAKSPAARPTAAQLVVELDRLLAIAPSGGGVRRVQHLFTVSGVSDLGQALTAQIRQVLLELANVLDKPVESIETIQQELSDRELELAMAESDVEAALDGAADRRDATADSVTQLQRALAEAYRVLFDAVTVDRDGGTADAQDLFGELDALVEQYRTL